MLNEAQKVTICEELGAHIRATMLDEVCLEAGGLAALASADQLAACKSAFDRCVAQGGFDKCTIGNVTTEPCTATVEQLNQCYEDRALAAAGIDVSCEQDQGIGLAPTSCRAVDYCLAWYFTVSD